MINIFKYIFVLLILSEAIVFPLSPESSLNQKGMLHPTEKDDNLLTKLDIAEFITQLEKFQTLLRECNITYFEDNNPFQQLLEKKEKVEPISHNELKQQFKSAFQKISQLLYGNISKATPLEMLQKLLHKNIALFAPLLYSFSNDSEEFQFEIFRFFVSQDFSSPKVLSETCDLFYQAIDASTLEPKDKDSRRKELTDAILLYLIFNKGSYSGDIGKMEAKIQRYGLKNKDPELKEEIRAFLSPPPTPSTPNTFLSKAPLPSKGFFPIYKALLSSVASSDSSEKKAKLAEQLKKIIIPLLKSFVQDDSHEDMLQLFDQISYLLMNYPTYRKIFSEIFSYFSKEDPSNYAGFASFIQELYKKESRQGLSNDTTLDLSLWLPMLDLLPFPDHLGLLKVNNILDHTPSHPYMCILIHKYIDHFNHIDTLVEDISIKTPILTTVPLIKYPARYLSREKRNPGNYILAHIKLLIHTTNFRSKEASHLFVSLLLKYIEDNDPDVTHTLEFLMSDFYSNENSHNALTLISQKILEKIAKLEGLTLGRDFYSPSIIQESATRKVFDSITRPKFEQWLKITFLSLKENSEYKNLAGKLLSFYLRNSYSSQYPIAATWLLEEESRMDLIDRAVLKDLLDSFLSSPSSDPQVIQLIKIITRKLINTSLDSESDNEWNNSYKKAFKLLFEKNSSLISIPEDLQDKAPFLTKLLAFLKRENFDLDTENKGWEDFILWISNNKSKISLLDQSTLQELLAPSSCSPHASEKEFYNYFLKLYSQQTVQAISKEMEQNQPDLPMTIPFEGLPHDAIEYLALCISNLHQEYLENTDLSQNVDLAESTLEVMDKQLLTCKELLSRVPGQEKIFFKDYISLFTNFPEGSASRVCQLTLTITYKNHLPEGTSLRESLDTISPSSLQPLPSLFKLLIEKCWKIEQGSPEEDNEVRSLYSTLLWGWDAPCEARELETYRFLESKRAMSAEQILALCQSAYTSIKEAGLSVPHALAKKKELTKTIFSYITFNIFSNNEPLTEWMKDKIEEYVLKDLTPEKRAAIQRLSSEDSRYCPIAPDDYISPKPRLTPRALQVQNILINPELAQDDAIAEIKKVLKKDIHLFTQENSTEELILLLDEISVWTHNKTMLIPIFQKIYDDYSKDDDMFFSSFLHPFIQSHYAFKDELMSPTGSPFPTSILQEILLPSAFRIQTAPNLMKKSNSRNNTNLISLQRLMHLRYYLALKDFKSLDNPSDFFNTHKNFLDNYPIRSIDLVGLVDMVNLRSDSDCEFFADFVFKNIETSDPREENYDKEARWNFFLEQFVEKVKKYPDLNKILCLITKRIIDNPPATFPFSILIDFESWLTIIASSPQEEEAKKRIHKGLLSHCLHRGYFKYFSSNIEGLHEYFLDNLQALLDGAEGEILSHMRYAVFQKFIFSLEEGTLPAKLNHLLYTSTEELISCPDWSFLNSINSDHFIRWITLIASYNSEDPRKGTLLRKLLVAYFRRQWRIKAFLENGDINACFLDSLQPFLQPENLKSPLAPEKLNGDIKEKILRDLIAWASEDASRIDLLNQNTLEAILKSLPSKSNSDPPKIIALIQLIRKKLETPSPNLKQTSKFDRQSLSLLDQNALEKLLRPLLYQSNEASKNIVLIQLIIERLINLYPNLQTTYNLKELYSQAWEILIPSIYNLDSIIFKEQSLSLVNEYTLEKTLKSLLSESNPYPERTTLIRLITERLISSHTDFNPISKLQKLYSQALKILIPSISNLDSIIFKEESLSLLNEDQLKEMITFCLQNPSMFTAEGFENRIKVILSLNRALIEMEESPDSFKLQKRVKLSTPGDTRLERTFQFFQKTYLESDYKPTPRTDPIPETLGLLFKRIDSSSLEPASEKTLYYDFFSRYFEKYDSLNYFLDKPSSPKNILAALFDILDNPPSSSYPIKNLAKGFKDFWDWNKENGPKGLLDQRNLRKMLESFGDNFRRETLPKETETYLATILSEFMNDSTTTSVERRLLTRNSHVPCIQKLLQNA